ncbi:putative Ig domain-containing protein [Spirosoma agri]|uniref:Dystroglycan-type cadherin-like domain-containing protein n=1 Tax=Spirosoma agri TaxID=1987381 RepID=A0A6M0IHK7_9BACT|nr:putative Ig domain-containing protein [Spirosoma agri]NEU67756.1 hypothetical protein [Spirosoma agri]
MGQIVVTRPGKPDLPLFNQEPARTVSSAVQSCKLLSEDVINMTVESVIPLDFSIRDSILVFGTTYTLNRLPKSYKEGDRRYKYDLTFEGPQYSLLPVLFLNQDASGFATGSDFPLTGDLGFYANVLLTNLKRVYGATAWKLGTIPPGTPTLNLSFNAENSLAVIQKLCTEFDTEFSIVRDGTGTQTINFGKVGQILGHTYEYGRGKGLYNLSRESVNNAALISRLYAYGGSKNIPSSYRNFATRLRLDNTLSFLENASAKAAFGLIEGTKIWEDIYPHRTGTISTVGAITANGKTFTLTDTSLEFDLYLESGPAQTVGGKTVKQYSYLLPGVAPKIHFQSGGLAGYEFEINKYDHTTKTFTLITTQDERSMVLPSPTSTAFQPKAGDTYILVDLIMPSSYITAAEDELRAKAQEYLNENSKPRVQYSLTLDEEYLASQQGTGSIVNFFSLGDYLSIKDTGLNIDGASRVTGFTRNVLSPNKYTVDIADTYEITRIEQMLSDQKAITTLIKLNNLSDPARARYGWQAMQEMLNMVFDTDDYFKDGNIRPNSIATNMIAVGAKSQQFAMNCVIEPNFEGKPNVVKVNAGNLTHYTVEETIRTWQIITQTTTIPDDAARYIYAKCSKTNYNDGTLIFSTDQIKPNDSATYYHFLVGVLNSKDATVNVRWISLTYGATAINGRFIKTGRIQSFDGTTYFDLDLGEIGGKITFVATDGSVKPISALTKTTIDAGIVTTGGIELGGEGGSIKAGITGEGTDDSSVRIYAGSTKNKRQTAAFRVTQAGEVFARKRIELTNENNVGQAGLAGSNTTADGFVRMYAGKPYPDRNTAPFRVNADGSMVASSGQIAKWTISNTGLINNDGSAFLIVRSSTNPHRTEGRLGAFVFSSNIPIKAAGHFIATETGQLGNIAGYFEAANGGKNWAIYAQDGISQLGEALINGRRYYGETLTDLTRSIDPSAYDLIEIYPQGNSAGIRFSPPGSPLKNGKEVTIINCNDTSSALLLLDILRGSNNWNLPGGGVLTLVFSNNFWYIKSIQDNNWGESGPPFVPAVANPAPTRVGTIPDVTISDRATKSWQIPAGIFVDVGDTLSFYITSNLPDGITFDGGDRRLIFDDSAINGTIPIAVKVTDSANQSVTGNFTLVLNRPSLNPPPIITTPFPTQVIAGVGARTITVPAANTFTDVDAMLFDVVLLIGTGLPAGITYNPDSLTLDIAETVRSGSLALKVIATDTLGQSTASLFILTINRSVVNVPPAVAVPILNQTLTGIGELTYDVPANTFNDPGDVLTISGTGLSGAALPAGITFTAALRRFVIASSVGAGSYSVEAKATDSGNLSVVSAFMITVVRSVTIPITVSDDPTEWTEDPIVPPTPDPGASDPQGEKDVKFYTSSSGNDGGPI